MSANPLGGNRVAYCPDLNTVIVPNFLSEEETAQLAEAWRFAQPAPPEHLAAIAHAVSRATDNQLSPEVLLTYIEDGIIEFRLADGFDTPLNPEHLETAVRTILEAIQQFFAEPLPVVTLNSNPMFTWAFELTYEVDGLRPNMDDEIIEVLNRHFGTTTFEFTSIA